MVPPQDVSAQHTSGNSVAATKIDRWSVRCMAAPYPSRTTCGNGRCVRSFLDRMLFRGQELLNYVGRLRKAHAFENAHVAGFLLE